MFLLPRKRRALSGGNNIGSNSSVSSSGSSSSSSESPSPEPRFCAPVAYPVPPSNLLAPAPALAVRTAPQVELQMDGSPQMGGSQMRMAAAPRVMIPTPIPRTTPPAPRTWPCRECGVQLSSASNRIRHERAQHGDKLAASVTLQQLGSTFSVTGRSGPGNGMTAGCKRSAGAAALPIGNEERKEDDGEFLQLAITPMTSVAPAAAAVSARQFPVLQPSSVESSVANHVDLTAELKSPPREQMATQDILMTDSEPDSMLHSSSFVDSEECDAKQQETSLDQQKDGGAAAAEVEPAKKKREVTSSAVAASAAEFSPPQLAQDLQLQSVCEPFLQWMCQPPITQTEVLVKGRGRVKQASQLSPVKLNLRFILALLMDGETIFAEVPELDILTTLPACKAVAAALENRQVGSGRTHAIFLLIKKVLVFLSSRESSLRRQFLPPTTYESYMYVDSICSDSSHRRRQETRNRALLGVQTSKMLHKSQPVRHLEPLSTDAFAMPSMFGNSRPFTAAAPSMAAERDSPPPAVARKVPHSHVAAAATAADQDLSPNELTHEELKAVASGSLAYLQQREPTFYVHHLVTATLCLGLAPRSQLLKQLRLGSSFVKEADGRWWIRMVGEVMKNGKPTVIALPKQLTEPYEYYFATIRPGLLRQQKGMEGGEGHDYVFFKKNGSAPRTDFADFTTIATTQLVGRAINPHAFRAAVVTAFYETGATQSDMDILANIMCHDSATARAYYYRPKMAKAAVDTGDRMINALDISATHSVLASGDGVVLTSSTDSTATVAAPATTE